MSDHPTKQTTRTTDHPLSAKAGVGFVCTPLTPWAKGKPTPVVHPSAHEIGEQRDGYPGGDEVTMRCPVCGHEWEMELSQ